jgi:predicted transcriptional regulator
MTETETKTIFDTLPDEAAEAAADAAAEADISTGRIVPHTKVAEWLGSWGKPDEPPCPTPTAS